MKRTIVESYEDMSYYELLIGILNNKGYPLLRYLLDFMYDRNFTLITQFANNHLKHMDQILLELLLKMGAIK